MSMSLDELAELKPGRGPQECACAYALRSLPPEKAGALRRALDNKPAARSSDIARELRNLGFPCVQQSVSRHRRGDCACES